MHLSCSLLCPAWLRTRSVLWMWHEDFELQWYIPPPDGVSQRCHHFALDKERRRIHVLPALSIFINTSNSHPLKTPTEINWGDSWWHGRLPGYSAQPAGLCCKFVALVVVDSLCGFGCASNSPTFSLTLTYASWREFESPVLGSNAKWWWNWWVALLCFGTHASDIGRTFCTHGNKFLITERNNIKGNLEAAQILFLRLHSVCILSVQRLCCENSS